MRRQLSHPSWVCPQPGLLSHGVTAVTAVSLVRETLRCDQSTSLPEGAFADAPDLFQERGTPADTPCSGCFGGGLFALTRLQLTSLTWRPHQGCSHTVEIRLGAHFPIHIPD